MTDRAVFSVDVELFTQTPAYRSAIGEIQETGVGLDGIDYLLEALDEHDAAATFFVVSSLAERYPETIRSIADAGHEVASHSHSHALLPTLEQAERRRDLARSRAVLERVTGQPVTGLRAPAFDLPPTHFDDLAAAGYGYDSSVVPARSVPGWYGGKHDVRRPAPATRVRADAPAGLVELPVSVMPGLRLPLTGAWLRFFGAKYTIAGMKLLARQGVTPVLYVHPWELIDLPAVEGVPARVYWRTGAWTRRAVDRILAQDFEFVTARTAIEGAEATSVSAPSTIHRDGVVERGAGDAILEAGNEPGGG